MRDGIYEGKKHQNIASHHLISLFLLLQKLILKVGGMVGNLKMMKIEIETSIYIFKYILYDKKNGHIS